MGQRTNGTTEAGDSTELCSGHNTQQRQQERRESTPLLPEFQAKVCWTHYNSASPLLSCSGSFHKGWLLRFIANNYAFAAALIKTPELLP